MKLLRTERMSNVRLVSITVLAAAFLLTACSRPPPVIGIEHPAVKSTQVAGTSRHKILIATTRAPSDAEGEFYASSRGQLGFATVDVSVPPNHKPGEIERTRTPPPDPRKHFVIENPARAQNSAAFASEVRQELRKRKPGSRDVMVFVHGYNTTLSDAVLQLTQFVEDTGYKGVPVLFSWASSGETVKYIYDVNSAVIARDALTELSSILESTAVEGFDIVAHSMGTLVTMEAIRQVSLEGDFRKFNRLNTVVLAAPDIDLDLFRSHVAAIPGQYRDIVVLTSRDDRALKLSGRIAGGVPRVGQANAPELLKQGITVVDLSAVEDQGSFSHSKYRDAPEVVQRVGDYLRGGDDFGEPRVGAGQTLVFGVEAIVQAPL